KSQGPTEIVFALRTERCARGARDEAAERRASSRVRHDGIEGISQSQAGGAKPIALHLATRDAGFRRDCPPDAGPGEIAFHTPDERLVGLQIVAQRAPGKTARGVVDAAGPAGPRGPTGAAQGPTAVDANIGAGPIIETHGWKGGRRSKVVGHYCGFVYFGPVITSGSRESRRRGK